MLSLSPQEAVLLTILTMLGLAGVVWIVVYSLFVFARSIDRRPGAFMLALGIVAAALAYGHTAEIVSSAIDLYRAISHGLVAFLQMLVH